MTKGELAEKYFNDGYNCAQAVVLAFCDEMNMNKETALRLASSFGGGMGRLREVCGAVSGMAMVASMLKGYSDPKDHEGKKALYKLTQEMCAEFEREMGSVICRNLLGLKPGESLPEPSIRTEEYYRSRPCVKACRVAAEITEKYLDIK